MKTLYKNHKGFAHVGLLLLFVVVIAAVGGVGYYVMSRNNKDNLTEASSTQNISSQQNSAQTTQHSVANSIEIKEWGVKVTAPSTLTGVTYKIEGDRTVFTSDQQKQLDCDEVQNAWGVNRKKAGALLSPDGSHYSDADADKNPSYIHIGGYYYLRSYPQMGCESQSDKAQTIDEAYSTLFKSLTLNE